MGNYKGGTHILSGQFKLIKDEIMASRFLNIRNDTSNGNIDLSADGAEPSGFLKAEDARQFCNTGPNSVYVRGTAGQKLFWDVTE